MSDSETSVAPPSAVSPQPSALAAVVHQASNNDPDQQLPWPPGCIGETARFIYSSAPRPVREVAIVAALGLHAGICGKAWNVDGTGLNLYITLVARSAIGKEAMHSGIALLQDAISRRFPYACFAEFTDYASGPALVKALASNTCFVNVAGEWGHMLRRLARDNANDTGMMTLRRVMTNLYSKSGHGSVTGGLGYSDTTKNIASITGVAYSMIGETTPETFYSALSSSIMKDGFMSRFNVVEYTGERPALNRKRITAPPKPLEDWLTAIVQYAHHLRTSQSPPIQAQPDNDADELFDAFEEESDKQINSSDDESYRQAWNRAALKVKRLSALMAVADRPDRPIIQLEHVQWALMLVRRDIAKFTQRQQAGDVGNGDQARAKKLLSIAKEYFQNGAPASYKVHPAMRENGIITRKYLQLRVNSVALFQAEQNQRVSLLDQTMKQLIDDGYFMEVQKDKMVEAYSFHGKCYRLLNLPA